MEKKREEERGEGRPEQNTPFPLKIKRTNDRDGTWEQKHEAINSRPSPWSKDTTLPYQTRPRFTIRRPLYRVTCRSICAYFSKYRYLRAHYSLPFVDAGASTSPCEFIRWTVSFFLECFLLLPFFSYIGEASHLTRHMACLS